MAKGLLIASFDFSAAAEDEFNDWYDTEHIPERARVPGFLACQRWIGASDAKLSVAVYDLEDLAVLETAAYRAIAHANLSPWSRRVIGQCRRILRFEGEQILPGDQPSPPAAEGLLLNAMNVDPDFEAEFNAWYDEEHVPGLARVPGVLSARRFRAAGGSHKYVALYHLASVNVVEQTAWSAAVQTPWTERIRPHYRDRLRLVCRRYERVTRSDRVQGSSRGS